MQIVKYVIPKEDIIDDGLILLDKDIIYTVIRQGKYFITVMDNFSQLYGLNKKYYEDKLEFKY